MNISFSMSYLSLFIGIWALASACTPSAESRSAKFKNTSANAISAEQELPALKIEGCNVSYNGKPLDFSKPFKAWHAAIGLPRKTTTTSETWVVDDIGFKLLVSTKHQRVISVSVILYTGKPFDIDEDDQSHLGSIKNNANKAHPRLPYTQPIWFNGALIQNPFDENEVNQQIKDHTGSSDNLLGRTYADHIIAAATRCERSEHPDYQGKEMVFVIDTQPHDTSNMLTFGFGISLE